MLKFTSGGVDGLGRASRTRLAYRRRLPRGHPGVPMALKQHRPTAWQRAGRKGRSAPASLATKENGQPCRAPKLRESENCLMHSLEHAEEMAEARRLGGLRRRREVAVSGAHEFAGLQTAADIRRIPKIGVLDTRGLENSIARARTLAYLAMTAIKLLEVGELKQRLAALEAAVQGQKSLPESVFDVEPTSSVFSVEVGA